MVFGPIIGAGFGAVAGAAVSSGARPATSAAPTRCAPLTRARRPRSPQLGAAVFSGDRPKDYKYITEAADRDDNIRTPASANITDKMRGIIPLTPEWTTWPDYDRVRARLRPRAHCSDRRWRRRGARQAGGSGRGAAGRMKRRRAERTLSRRPQGVLCCSPGCGGGGHM